jgi:riboflavin kinase/FMN adenylyltransferase
MTVPATQIFQSLAAIPPGFGPTVAAAGNFDGVHMAHAAVIAAIQQQARAIGGKSVVITFEPHPTRILRPDVPLQLITPTPVKVARLAATGVDAVLVLPFTRDLSLLSPREFVEQVLVQKLHVAQMHEGFNFRFGNRAAGDTALLQELGRELGFGVTVYPEMRLRGETVSSTRIRELVREGRMERARTLLGRPFSIIANPGRGRGIGSRLVVPTINLARYDELVPKLGVYITRTRISNGDATERFDSVTNVGNRPTFGADSFAIETHLLNFHPLDLLPDTEVEITFLARIRDERRFDSPEELKAQILQDAAHAQRYLRLAHRIYGR